MSPNLQDYVTARQAFSWDEARRRLDGLPGGRGLNIAHEAVDRHASGPRAARVALRCVGPTGERRDLTYAALCRHTNRFANALERLGVRKGDVVATLAGPIPQLYVAVLGTLKQRAISCPLSPALEPEPVLARLQIARARALLTTDSLYRRKVQPLRAHLPYLEHVLLVRESDHPAPPGACDLETVLAAMSDAFPIGPTDPEDVALLHFTSGTTGRPKGTLHVHDAVVAHDVTARYALDLHPEDRFWCTADPGCVTGTSYGIIAPLVHGLTNIVDEADFDAHRWSRIVAEEGITVCCAAPTEVRTLLRADATGRHDLASLRFLAGMGEPLTPEAVVWGQDAFGQPFHDHWWQTETGGIMIANFTSMDIRPGSMGRPVPGVEAAIVRRTPDGEVVTVDAPDARGELALRPGWPSMFRGYLYEPDRYAKCFAGGYYLTGDLARRDEDGYFWFVGRADDVITSAGSLIGAFEVERVLLEHSAVAEAGVIAKPDPVQGEVVKAFVALRPGVYGTNTLRRELLAFARTRLDAAVAPRELAFLPNVPKTRSGKIMRRLLKARELGLPEGDTSTLDEP